MSNPPETLVEDPHLSVEDFLTEEHTNPTPLESDALPKLASPASVLVQATPGSAHSAPIILNDGKLTTCKTITRHFILKKNFKY